MSRLNGVLLLGVFLLTSKGALAADTVVPVISITSLAAQSGQLVIQMSAADNIKVTRAECFIDGVFRGRDSKAPYSVDCTERTSCGWVQRLSEAWVHGLPEDALQGLGYQYEPPASVVSFC